MGITNEINTRYGKSELVYWKATWKGYSWLLFLAGVLFVWPSLARAEVCDKVLETTQGEGLFWLGLGLAGPGLIGSIFGRLWPMTALIVAPLWIGGSCMFVDWELENYAATEGCAGTLYGPVHGGLLAAALTIAGASWGAIEARRRSSRSAQAR